MNRLVAPVLAAFLLAACAPRAVVFVSRSFDPASIRRVAVVEVADYPGAVGSGEIAAGAFEKYLLWAGWSVVERRQVRSVLKEQSLGLTGALDPESVRGLGRILGVDALVFGSLTDFANVREQTVLVDRPQEHSEPVYGQVVTVNKSGDTLVRTVQNVVTGYSYSQTSQLVPEIATLPARAGLSMRLVDAQTAEVLWSASAASEAVDLHSAVEQASSKIMQGVVKSLQKAARRK
jgi:hypothetical protein